MPRALAIAMLLAGPLVLVAEACGETLPAHGGPEPDSGSSPEVDATSTPPDSSPVDADVDAADAAEGCNPTADFTAPVLIGGLEDIDVVRFSLTADEKLAFYVTFGGEVFRAPMVNAQLIGTPTPIVIDFADASVFTDGAPQNISVSADGGVIFFEAGFDLWSAVPAGDGGYVAKRLSVLYGDPFLDEPGNRVFATKKIDGGGLDAGREIVAAPRVGLDSIAAFVPVGVRAPATSPLPSPDAGGLFFSADLPARSADILYTALPPVADADVPVANVSSATKDHPSWISKDGCRLYLIAGVDSPFGRAYLSRRGR